MEGVDDTHQTRGDLRYTQSVSGSPQRGETGRHERLREGSSKASLSRESQLRSAHKEAGSQMFLGPENQRSFTGSSFACSVLGDSSKTVRCDSHSQGGLPCEEDRQVDGHLLCRKRCMGTTIPLHSVFEPRTSYINGEEIIRKQASISDQQPTSCYATTQTSTAPTKWQVDIAQSAERVFRNPGGIWCIGSHVNELFWTHKLADASSLSEMGKEIRQGKDFCRESCRETLDLPSLEEWLTQPEWQCTKSKKIGIGKHVSLSSQYPESSSWPLHIKGRGHLNLEYISQCLADSQLSHISTPLYRFLCDEAFYRSVSFERIFEADLTQNDIFRLLEAGYIEETQMGEIRGSARIFAVAEAKKQRRRPITNTETINFAYTNVPYVALPTVEEIRDACSRASYACSIDFAGWFFQFPLTAEVSAYHGFSCNNKFFVWKRLPMGQRQSVAIAHLATLALAAKAAKGIPAIEVFTYIDNVLALGDERGVSDFFNNFMKQCDLASAVVGEALQCVEEAVFLGMHFDLKTHTVRPSQSTVLAITQHSPWMTVTLKEFCSIYGESLPRRADFTIALGQILPHLEVLQKKNISIRKRVDSAW